MMSLNFCGLYFSKSLEDVFLELANVEFVNCSAITFQPNSYLHVLTQAYTTGGHTRVVEKWIQQADATEEHNVVLLKQEDNEIPHISKNIFDSREDSFFVFNEKDLLARALKLRALASRYEYIILHTHMEDPTALVAFGHAEFSRSVIFYNHASHLFWLGKSIVDVLADIRPNDEITQDKRAIDGACFVGIPVNIHNDKVVDKKHARNLLHLNQEKNIIITIGSTQKFLSLCR